MNLYNIHFHQYLKLIDDITSWVKRIVSNLVFIREIFITGILGKVVVHSKFTAPIHILNKSGCLPRYDNSISSSTLVGNQ